MTAALPAYSDYRDSGLPWLGRMPSHWQVVRAGRLFQEVVDVGHAEKQLLSITNHSGIVRQSETGRKTRASRDRSAYKLIRPGELGYNLMNAFMGSIGVSPYEGILSPAYAVARARQPMHVHYYHFLLRTSLLQKEFNRHSYGIMYERNRLYFERFKAIEIPQPSADEQKAIADYLDGYGRLVNRLVRSKQRLIERLNEQKQVLIHRAVTRGLNPDARLKPSGIEWLGDVPEHWSVMRLKNIAEVVLGKMLKSSPSYGDQLKPYLRSTNIQWLAPELDDVATMWFSEAELRALRIRANDVLVSEGGEVGRACIWGNELSECYIQNSVHKVTAGPAVRAHFLLHQFFLMGKAGFFGSIVNRVSIAHLTREKLVSVRFAVPPLTEQDAMLVRIRDETGVVDAAIQRAEHEIELIREYRDRLISDVVTGQVDVRGLPVPADSEPEPSGIADLALEGEELEEIAEGSDADD